MKLPFPARFALPLLGSLLLCVAASHGERPAFSDSADPVAGMGVNIHFTDARPGELEMLAQAGFRWIRMDLGWASTEKTAAVYDFTAYDRLLASLEPRHLRALLIFDYTNPLYDDNKPSCTDEGRAAFARWAVAAVTHFQGRGVAWEIWNEPNGGWFWKPQANPEDYAKLALTVSEAIQRAAPQERLLGPALNGSNLDFVEVSAEAGVLPYWSGITLHPYTRTGPETFGAAYEQTRRFIARYVPPEQNTTVMCGELGYSTAWPEIDEATEGEYLARLFLFDVMSGVPLTIWYDWHDDGTDPKSQEDNFGIVHHDYHSGAANVYDPKPAYDAAATYARQLTGFRFKERIKTASGDDYVLRFIDGKTECLAAWTTAASPHPLRIEVPDGIYDLTSFDGKTHAEIPAVGGALLPVLDGGPQYLKPHQPTP